MRTLTDLSLSELPWDGTKVRLHRFLPSDITREYISWLNNSMVVRYSNQRFYTHDEESCRCYLNSFTGTANQFLIIRDSSAKTALGTLTIYISTCHLTADIGILIGNVHNWGKGIGFDAFRTAVDVLQRCGGIRKITAGCVARNVGMVRIMEKVGMSLEATRYRHELLDGQPVDVLYYSKFCDA